MRREYMIEFREKNGLTTLGLARKCRISKTLLEMLEASDQEVTHPKIAERIAKVYGLTKQQKEELMPEHYRKSSPNYDPDKYKNEVFDYADFAVTRRC